MIMEYRTQKILLTGRIDDESYSYLRWCCEQSNSLYNCTLFEVRQAHFEQCGHRYFFDKYDQYRASFKLSKVKVSYAQLCKQLKDNPHYQATGGQQGQQTIKSVVFAIKAYNKLLPMWFKGELKHKPNLPNYRTSNGLYQVCFTNQNLRYEAREGVCYLPIAKINKNELETPVIAIPSGYGFEAEQLAELRIIPSQGKLWAEYIYQVDEQKAHHLDYSQAISIDSGVNNWITAVSTLGRSFIVCGKRLKFINHKYNQFVAKYKQGKSDFYWDETLEQVTHKRNCQMRDAINKTARFLINHCLANGIGNIVFGWNSGNKQSVAMSKKNNQNFVQIPTARLKTRIQELAKSVGINFVETEEAYTSKSSFIDRDLLPRHGEKPSEYKFSGKRVKRGLYQASNRKLINADCNGAANILRKVITQLKVSLAKVSGAVLTLPKRYDLYDLSKSYRKWSEQDLSCVATSI